MPGLVAGGNTTAARALGVSPLMVQLADRPLGDELQLLYRWTGRFGVALHSRQKEWVFTTNSGAAFVVDQAGRTVTCHGRASDWAGATAEAFVRRVLPRIVQLQGRTVLHAAALDTGAGVVLLCGHSGAGKIHFDREPESATRLAHLGRRYDGLGGTGRGFHGAANR